MKIADVRQLLPAYTKPQLQLIITEMYRVLPKTIKEDRDIDGLLKKPDTFAEAKKRKKTVPKTDIASLQAETEQFITYAYNQFYFVPNTVVPKRVRSKWRFVAKRLYKSWLLAAATAEDAPVASAQLEKLYAMLCHSCHSILFSAYDSFESVGIEQTTFFQSVLTLKKKHAPVAEFVPNAVALIVENSVNRYTLPTDLMHVALEFFLTPDSKELAIQYCHERIEERKSAEDKTRLNRREAYKDKSDINKLVEMTFLCYGALHEYGRGIQYFNENYREEDPEIKLYILLHWLYACVQPDEFIGVYERAVEKGVTPREQLTRVFEVVRATGAFPERFH